MIPLQERVIHQGLCTMCGVCAAACPPRCIRMRITSKGMLLPEIDESACIRCNRCLSVCPGHDVHFPLLAQQANCGPHHHPLVGSFRRCYIGYASDPRVRKSATSGGIVSSLLCHGLSSSLIRTAVVARMRQDRPMESESFCASTPADILSALGSKYVPVSLDAAREAVSARSPFAVVGLPCHIHALRKWGVIQPEIGLNGLLIGLMCGYGKTFHVLRRTVHRAGLKTEDVRKVTFRTEGWPGVMLIETHGGSQHRIPFREWFRRDSSPLRCTVCVDGSAELADISCGDAWLPEFRQDPLGVSVVVARTPKGEEWIERARGANVLSLEETTPDKIAESQFRMLKRKKMQFRAHAALARPSGRPTPDYHLRFASPGGKDWIEAAVTRLRLALTDTPIGSLVDWVIGIRRRSNGCLAGKKP